MEVAKGMPPKCQRLVISWRGRYVKARVLGLFPFLSQFPAPLFHCPHPNRPRSSGATHSLSGESLMSRGGVGRGGGLASCNLRPRELEGVSVSHLHCTQTPALPSFALRSSLLPSPF